MKSRKQINLGTVAGDEDGGVGYDLLMFTVGGRSDSLVSRKVKHHGKRTLTILQNPVEPSSESDVDIDDAVLAESVKVLTKSIYGNGTLEEEFAFFDKLDNVDKTEEKLQCEICEGKWHRPLKAEPPRVPPIPSGGDQEDVEPCEICYGRHKKCPLIFQFSCGRPFPKINPIWYVACDCCLGREFEEKTADCARCGSVMKNVYRKLCSVCIEVGHFDNTDKQCLYYGRGAPVYDIPFTPSLPSSPAGIKKSRQRSIRKKLAKKKKVDDAAA